MATDKVCHQLCKGESYDFTKSVFCSHLSENATEKRKQKAIQLNAITKQRLTKIRIHF